MKNQNIYVYVFVSISQSYGSRLWGYGCVIVGLCGSLCGCGGVSCDAVAVVLELWFCVCGVVARVEGGVKNDLCDVVYFTLRYCPHTLENFLKSKILGF